MSDVSKAQEILTRAVNELLLVGKERNYRSDAFWNALHGITVAQTILLRAEYPSE